MFDYSLVDKTVDEIVRRFSPEKVIIFGSVARQEADDLSDLDILVVMDTDDPPYKRAAPIYLAVSSIRIPKDTIVLTPKEFAEDADNRFSFTSKIASTGVVAYAA